MAVSDDCARQRSIIESLVADFKNLTTATDRTEKQLAALKAARADPQTIASVEERLSAEQEQLAETAVAGKSAVEEYQGECVDRPLPAGATEFLTTGAPASGPGTGGAAGRS
ncbi:hypothetical protein ABTY61_27685 [Kitasatospora sp. NPDC096128]|uniref:hypothetical protein n=1 Tax=Kitasatospora sp. NPDC096128 TaxID=3155547 RepID=UPI0033197AA2